MIGLCRYFICVILLFSLPKLLSAQTPKISKKANLVIAYSLENAEKIAESYFRFSQARNIDSLLNLSGFPFQWNDRIFKAEVDLKREFFKIFSKDKTNSLPLKLDSSNFIKRVVSKGNQSIFVEVFFSYFGGEGNEQRKSSVILTLKQLDTFKVIGIKEH